MARQAIGDKPGGKAGHFSSEMILLRNEHVTILIEPSVGRFRGMATGTAYMYDGLYVLQSRKAEGRS